MKKNQIYLAPYVTILTVFWRCRLLRIIQSIVINPAIELIGFSDHEHCKIQVLHCLRSRKICTAELKYICLCLSNMIGISTTLKKVQYLMAFLTRNKLRQNS